MIVTRSLAYAIQSLVQLASVDSKTPTSCRVLAEKGSLPERFLLQILCKLTGHGILRSVGGVEGGYVLARPAEAITLLDLFDALEMSFDASLPPLPIIEPYAHGMLKQTMHRTAGLVNRELERLSLSDLIDPRPAGIEGQLCLPVQDPA